MVALLQPFRLVAVFACVRCNSAVADAAEAWAEAIDETARTASSS
jgi:hypothetical protein